MRIWKGRAVCHVLSRVQLFSTPWTVALQAPLSTEFSRQEYWGGLPFLPPGDLSDPEIEAISPVSPALAGRFFTLWTMREVVLGYWWGERLMRIRKEGLSNIKRQRNGKQEGNECFHFFHIYQKKKGNLPPQPTPPLWGSLERDMWRFSVGLKGGVGTACLGGKAWPRCYQ